MQKYEPGTPGYTTFMVVGVVTRVITNFIPIALMAWAAFETSGFLRWALLGWVGFTLIVMIVVSSKWSFDQSRGA